MKRSQLEVLKEKIERLDAQEHAQIFEIVKRYTNNFTKTQSGALVSSDSLPEECLKEMEKMISFYLDQRVRMESDAIERKAMKNELKRN
jgi:purine-nucleoside phosphorylase